MFNVSNVSRVLFVFSMIGASSLSYAMGGKPPAEAAGKIQCRASGLRDSHCDPLRPTCSGLPHRESFYSDYHDTESKARAVALARCDGSPFTSHCSIASCEQF